MRRSLLWFLAVSLLAFPASTRAQIAWESPALISPAAPSGVSIFLIDPAGGDLGALVTYRHSAGPVGLGYRFGLAEESGPDGELAIAGGIDVSGYLSRAVEGSEVDLIWWSGGGLGIGNETLVTFPLGLILGWTSSGSGAVISPYGGGHLNLDIISGDGDNVDLNAAIDLGLDLVLESGWLIRFGATVGDRDTLAFGFRLPA